MSVDEFSIDWNAAKRQFPVGSVIVGRVSRVVGFGLFVEMPGSKVLGVVKAPDFGSADGFSDREALYPSGSEVSVRVLGFAEGRQQVDLEVLA